MTYDNMYSRPNPWSIVYLDVVQATVKHVVAHYKTREYATELFSVTLGAYTAQGGADGFKQGVLDALRTKLNFSPDSAKILFEHAHTSTSFELAGYLVEAEGDKRALVDRVKETQLDAYNWRVAAEEAKAHSRELFAEHVLKGSSVVWTFRMGLYKLGVTRPGAAITWVNEDLGYNPSIAKINAIRDIRSYFGPNKLGLREAKLLVEAMIQL